MRAQITPVYPRAMRFPLTSDAVYLGLFLTQRPSSIYNVQPRAEDLDASRKDQYCIFAPVEHRIS